MSQAARYVSLGWSIIPVDGTTKKPVIATWREFAERRASEQEIDSWSRRFPKAGIAVICGPVSGLLVLDADGDEGSTEARRRGLPKTPMVQTPGGGLHVYFKEPRELRGMFRNSCKVGDSKKLDVRGQASYVVAPVTKRSDGRRYEWIEKATTKLADPPAWFLELLRQKIDPPSSVRLKACAGTKGVPQVGVARVLSRLSEVARAWIETGHDLTKFPSRSENDYAAVVALLTAGASDEQIEHIFAAYPIGDRYREPGTGGQRYLDLTIRTARSKVKTVRVKYADLVEYDAADGKSPCKRLHLGLVVEDGDEPGRFFRTGVTVPTEQRKDCLPRWIRLFEALDLRPLHAAEVSYASTRRIIGRTMVIEMDGSRRDNPIAAFHKLAV